MKTKSPVQPATPAAPIDAIAKRILFIRGHRVILDADLAELYGVSTKAFNQAVKRNHERFDEDFMFQLTREEDEWLRSQTVTLKTGRGQHRKYLPYVFTEHGAYMAGNILNSPRAIGAKGGKVAWTKVPKKKRAERMRALAEKRCKK